MKRNILHILIVILIIMQAVSIMKINYLQKQIENTSVGMYNSNNGVRSEISAIYSNVNDMLRQEASLIENASAEIGTLNVGDLTASITFSLTPKEVSNHTAVSLDVNGEIFPMAKNGATFYATISNDIFGSVLPLIVIDESDVKKTTHDDRINVLHIKDSIFPAISPRIEGGSSYSPSDGIYKRKGPLILDVKKTPSKITFTEMHFVIKVDDEVISDEVIPNEPSGWQVDKAIPVSDGQICRITLIATDNIGLEHHYPLDYWVGDSNAQQRGTRPDYEEIYSADGELLWKQPDYEEFYSADGRLLLKYEYMGISD